MFRRWYVSVPLFLVAIGATLFVAARVAPDYVATSYVQLVPPAVTPKAIDDSKATARNPWLDLGLAALTKAGMISVQDQKVVKQLKSDGLSDDFTLTQDAQLPIVTFEVIGDDKAQATQTSEQLVTRFSDSVEGLQTAYGAPGDQMITAHRLDLGDNVKESTSKIKRALIAVAGVGVVLAAAMTVAVDAWMRRRARNRANARPTPVGPPAPDPDAAEPAAPSRDAAEPAAPSRDAAEPTAPAVAAAKRGTVVSGARSGKEYASQAARPPEVGEARTVVTVVPGENTIVLPPGEQPRNGRAKESKRP